MIKCFSDTTTEKIFRNQPLTKKEIRKFGSLNLQKALARLDILKISSEKDLLLTPSYHYDTLHNGRYSIDAESRKSKWRITFQWHDDELQDVALVKIKDTHSN